MRSASLVVVVVFASSGCILSGGFPAFDDGDVFADHGALDLDVAGLDQDDLDVRPDPVVIDGVVRAAVAADLDVGGLDDALADDGDLDEAFVIDDGVEPVLLSIHSETQEDGRSLLFQPELGTHLVGSVGVAGFFQTVSLVLEDDDGVAFAGTELVNQRLPGEPADVDVIDDPDGRVDATPCGHRREAQLTVTCGDTTRLRVGETVEACGMAFTNHSTVTFDDDIVCEDVPSPVIWSAVRP
jgi:hypothetical protein